MKIYVRLQILKLSNMRRKFLIANWKQNTNREEAIELLEELSKTKDWGIYPCKVVLALPFTHLHLLENSQFGIASQDCSSYSGGAYTGEISAQMLYSFGVRYSIVGHSERRQYFNDNAQTLKEKIQRCIESGITPIYCVGETLEQREANETFGVIQKQLEEVLTGIPTTQTIILAYEPVWAIGTGKSASPEQANEVHIFIRRIISNIFNQNFAENVSILYGGSVKPNTAQDLFSQSDIDGGLVGGASLIVNDFIQIAKSF